MKLLYFLAFSIIILFSNCKKDNSCTPTLTACNDTPEQNGLCTAFFTSWFFNKETNTCQEVGYSGCGPKGFTTKVECEACICNQ